MNIKFDMEQNEITIGQYLMQVRESLGLSREKIAEQLCLKVSVVVDIEENTNINNIDYTFLRGYIRAYAKLIKIPEEEIIILLNKHIPEKSTFFFAKQNYFFKKINKKKDYWLINFGFFIIIICISVIVVWWWQKHY